MNRNTPATAPAAPQEPARATLSDILAAGPTDGLPRTALWEKNVRLGRNCVTLPAGQRRFLNVTSMLIRKSLDDGGATALWSVRDDTDEGRYTPRTAREIEVHGVAEGLHSPEDPLPCTLNRGVAFFATEAAIRCFLDPDRTVLPLEEDVYHGVTEAERVRRNREYDADA